MYHLFGPLVKWPKTPASHAGNTSSNLVRVTIRRKLRNKTAMLFYIGSAKALSQVGVDYGEGPPVPIPNTEVKLTCAENTWTAASREDR